jgi:hypothetical protein
MTRRFCIRPHDDRGASLVLALVFITVVSVVVMTVLAFADTSMRATIALRGKASETAAAEGAANVAINTLRNGPYNGNSVGCFGAASTLPLDDFYQRSDGSRDSARVTCELDPNLGSAPVVMPQHALLTTDPTDLALPVGQVVTGYGAGNTFRVAGAVHSNSTISVANGNLTASGAITARRACTTLLGGAFSPAPTCNNGNQVNITYTLPSLAGLPTQTVPACGSTSGVYTLSPGVYTNSTGLSNLTKSTCHGGNAIVHLLPGIYHFNFSPTLIPPSIGVWSVTAGTVIAGNLRQGVTLTPGVQPPLPGACKSPVPTGPGWVAPEPGDGVTIVMGGNGQLAVTLAGRVEICGPYSPNALPVAIAAQQTTGTIGALCAATGWPCAALTTGQVVAGAPLAMYVQGTTMLPNREFVLALSPTSQQLYHGGVIARRAGSFSTRDAAAPAVIDVLPSNPTAPRRTVVYLNVFVCKGLSTCSTGGKLELRTKVAYTDPTGLTVAGRRQVSVLSWSLQG